MFRWGATHLPWGTRVYTDGSGLANASPELRRCGWAAVELSESGFPVRAVFGPLPGRQSVPRAERYAGLWAFEVAPQMRTLCSDHLSFVRESAQQHPELCSARGKFADIWRRISRLASQPSRCPVSFVWVKAHRQLEDVLDASQEELFDFLGNSWADFFARIGAMEHQVAQVAVDAEAEHLKAAKRTWDFLSRAVFPTSTIASQVERPEAPDVQKRGPRGCIASLAPPNPQTGEMKQVVL